MDGRFVYMINGVEVNRSQMAQHLGMCYNLNPNVAISQREQIALQELSHPRIAVSVNQADGSALYLV